MAELLTLRGPDQFGERPALDDLPAMLERTAARLRAGECGDVLRISMVMRATDREPAVLSFGNGPSCQVFEDLHLGATWLLHALEH